LIGQTHPFNNWSQLNLGVWGNGNTMVISGGSGYTQLTTSGSVTDLTDDLSVSNTSAGQTGVYRVYIRVSVCVPGLLEANCVQYGTHYKPEGFAAAIFPKIRFSAFGYLNQGGDVRQGGGNACADGLHRSECSAARFRHAASRTPPPSGTALRAS